MQPTKLHRYGPSLVKFSLIDSLNSKQIQGQASPNGVAVLHYVKGRGKANPVRFVLEETGTPYEEKFIATREALQALRDSGKLIYKQVTSVCTH